jgi:4-hydroxybenzoate polyprenyltransferase/phosphoglycolate phosphatase-like HAD superfamily hydrolase
MTETLAANPDTIDGGSRVAFPLVVDLDGTLLKVDSIYELFVAALFNKPLLTIVSLLELRNGIAAFKRRLCEISPLNIDELSVREGLLAYLHEQAAAGREMHLATAAWRTIAFGIAERFPIFKTVQSTDEHANLKGAKKAERLSGLFPDGFVYAGDSRADLPVWQRARGAVVVSSSRSLCAAVQSMGVPVEKIFEDKPSRSKAWLWVRAVRPHQWSKNVVVLVPLILGWRDVTFSGLLATLAEIAVLCLAASLTYIVNDLADLSSDRKHWSKRRRPFASAAIPVRDGLLLVGFALPATCLLAFLISPPAGIFVLAYIVLTLGYSFGWKRIPLFDAFMIASLFVIRVLIGIAAASLVPSAWLLTFSMFFFFSLALSKRHTEILRAAHHGLDQLEGRGYRTRDEDLVLTFGICTSIASVLIVVIYLVEEVFARRIYSAPDWLWVAPIAIFLFICRIWMLSHRGIMTDDAVAFALRDRVSLGLGVLVAIAILLAQ